MRSKFEDVSEYLPESVLGMIEAVGFVNTEKIIAQFGGSTFKFSDGEVYFPKLKELIGPESAVKLRQYFMGEDTYIPRCESALRILRNARLQADLDFMTEVEKKSIRTALLELCPKYSISDRQVWKILKKSRTTSAQNQATLF